MHVCMYMYVYVCISVYSYMYVYQYMHVYVSISDTGFEIYIHIHTICAYTCIHTIYILYVYCSIFGPYTYIYDIQFHILTYTDMHDTARAANRQPARGGAQEARWRGRPLHCTGSQPAAGSGRLRGGAGVRDALADDLLMARAANRKPALLAVGGRYVLSCLRGSPSVRGLPPGSWLWLAAGGCAQPQATGTAATLP